MCAHDIVLCVRSDARATFLILTCKAWSQAHLGAAGGRCSVAHVRLAELLGRLAANEKGLVRLNLSGNVTDVEIGLGLRGQVQHMRGLNAMS